MCLCLKRSSLLSFYALPSGGKPKGVLVHYLIITTICLLNFSLNCEIENKRNLAEI